MRGCGVDICKRVKGKRLGPVWACYSSVIISIKSTNLDKNDLLNPF